MKPVRKEWLMVTPAMDMVDMATTTTSQLTRMAMPIVIMGQVAIIIIMVGTTTVTGEDIAHTMAEEAIEAVTTTEAEGKKKGVFYPFFCVCFSCCDIFDLFINTGSGTGTTSQSKIIS